MRRSATNERPPSTAPIRTDPLGVHHTFPMPRATLAKSYSTPAEDVIEMESVNSTRQRMRNPRKPPARTLSRAQSIRETLSSGAASFFGVPPKPTVSVVADPVEVERDIKWKARRLRHMSRRYGAVREPSLDQQVAAGPLEDLMDSAVQPQTPIRDPLSIRRFLSSHQPSVDTAAVIGIDRSASTDSRGSKIRVLQRRDSVAKMAWDGLSTLVVKGSLKPKKPHVTSTIRRRRAQSRSFSPGSFIQSGDDSVFDSYSNMGSGSAMEPSFGDVFSPSSAGSTAKGSASHAYPESTMATIQEEPLGPRTSDRFSSDAHDSEGHICQGDRTPPFVDEEDAIDGHRMSASVAARTTSTDGLRRTDMLSQVPSLVSQDTSIHDDVFFDLTPQAPAVIQPMAPSPKVRTAARAPIQKMYSEGGAVPSMAPFAGSHHRHVHRIPHQGHRHHRQPPTAAQHPQARPSNLPGVRPFEYPPVIKHRQHLEPQEPVPTIRFAEDEPGVAYGQPGAYQRVAPDRPRIPPGLKTAQERKVRGVRRLKRQKKVELDERQRRHLVDNEPWTISNFLSKVAGNSDRRRYGEGALGKFFGRTLKRKSELSPHVVQQLTDSDDHRPYFTYWVTTVQILVTIIALAIYGFGPFGFGMEEKTANVLHSTVTLKQVAVYEQQNFWFGPKFSDLVHLGAKFSPCMRHDLKLYRQIEADRVVENTTGCCIYEDQTGCFQASADNCPKLIATHMKWTPSLPGPEGRISGAVCGQDPRSCEEPPSVDPFMWPDDITKWPICTKQPAQVSELRQMRCEITGRPCCIELHGQCRITTREYCDFVDGYFHEEATLCSQVSCLGEICGMIPFFRKDRPDQFYRLFFSLFLHAGIIHCLLSAALQMWLMRDLEKLVGWSRIAVVYICSGIAGNLASAIFVPYKAEVGPAGSQFGLLASLFVDAIYSWQMIVRPWKALLELGAITLGLFLIGLLPWVDNWAHMFGFIFGLLLSLATFPYIQLDQHDRTKRIVIVVVSLTAAVLLFALLIILFYVSPLWECKACKYFNCIPFTPRFCDNQGLDPDSWLPI